MMQRPRGRQLRAASLRSRPRDGEPSVDTANRWRWNGPEGLCREAVFDIDQCGPVQASRSPEGDLLGWARRKVSGGAKTLPNLAGGDETGAENERHADPASDSDCP